MSFKIFEFFHFKVQNKNSWICAHGPPPLLRPNFLWNYGKMVCCAPPPPSLKVGALLRRILVQPLAIVVKLFILDKSQVLSLPINHGKNLVIRNIFHKFETFNWLKPEKPDCWTWKWYVITNKRFLYCTHFQIEMLKLQNFFGWLFVTWWKLCNIIDDLTSCEYRLHYFNKY